MRWLLLKDLQILRRSPLLVALLVLYPVILAVLIGLALSAGPSKPKVAFANLVPPGQSTFSVGGKSVDAADYASRLFASIASNSRRPCLARSMRSPPSSTTADWPSRPL